MCHRVQGDSVASTNYFCVCWCAWSRGRRVCLALVFVVVHHTHVQLRTLKHITLITKSLDVAQKVLIFRQHPRASMMQRERRLFSKLFFTFIEESCRSTSFTLPLGVAPSCIGCVYATSKISSRFLSCPTVRCCVWDVLLTLESCMLKWTTPILSSSSTAFRDWTPFSHLLPTFFSGSDEGRRRNPRGSCIMLPGCTPKNQVSPLRTNVKKHKKMKLMLPRCH